MSNQISIAPLTHQPNGIATKKSNSSNDVIIFLIPLEMCLSVSENEGFYISLFSVRAQLRSGWPLDTLVCECLSSTSC